MPPSSRVPSRLDDRDPLVSYPVALGCQSVTPPVRFQSPAAVRWLRPYRLLCICKSSLFLRATLVDRARRSQGLESPAAVITVDSYSRGRRYISSTDQMTFLSSADARGIHRWFFLVRKGPFFRGHPNRGRVRYLIPYLHQKPLYRAINA